MIGRVLAIAWLCLWFHAASRAENLPLMQETPYFAEQVKTARLPPVEQRIPQQPRVADLVALKRQAGSPGGTLRMLIVNANNINQMTLNGYTRLVVYDENLNLVPDLLESFEVQEGRIFTLHLRAGHKWSDGEPFTAEDFRYYWEEVAKNKRLSPMGPRPELLSHGREPKFTVVDPLTLRYEWSEPNPGFLPALAAAQPIYIYMPAHYMKQFHEHYNDPKLLAANAKEEKVKDWGSIHERRSRQYRPENPELPSLDPWINTTKPPSENFVFVRNPYYHRVDSNGWQLPYVDRVRLSVVSESLVSQKAQSGEADLQAAFLTFNSYTALKQGEIKGHYGVKLWNRGEGSYASLVPNQNAKDNGWRQLIQDVRFRRALSLGINRSAVNKVIFFGLAQISANAMLSESPLFNRKHMESYAQYDPKMANQLLDEIGLTERDSDTIRKLPDGRPLEIVVETSGENSNEADILELVADQYRQLGIRVLIHSSQRELFRSRVISGDAAFCMWPGLDNGVATPDMEPTNLAPANQTQFNWPQWGLSIASNGQQGEKITLPVVQHLEDLLQKWRVSATLQERKAIWEEMLAINAEQVFIIGIVNRIPQPVVVAENLKNVPEKAIYSFEPGAFFGISRMDLFYFTNSLK